MLSAVLCSLIPLLGLCALHWPLFSSGFQAMHGDWGDGRLIPLVMEHGFAGLFQDWPSNPLVTPWAFYPIPSTLFYSDTLFGLQPFYAPWRLLGLEPMHAFQAFVITCSALNYLVMFLYLRRGIGFEAIPAMVGAFFFAFGLLRQEFLHHPQLIPNFYAVGALWALSFYARSNDAHLRLRALSSASLLIGLQCWAGHYHGWFLLLLLMWVALWFGLNRKHWQPLRQRLQQDRLAWVIAAVVFAVVLLPYILPYLQVQAVVARKKFSEILYYTPYWDAYLAGADRSWLLGSLYSQVLPTSNSLWRIFPGLTPVIALIVLTIIYFRKRRIDRYFVGNEVKIALFSAFCIVLVSVRWPESWNVLAGATLWKYMFFNIPGASAVRAVHRIVLLLAIPGAILLAQLVTSASHVRKPFGPILAALLVAYILGEQVSFSTISYPIHAHQQRVTAVIDQLKAHSGDEECRSFYQSKADRIPYAHVDAMYASFQTRIPTINGYSGNMPPGWDLDDTSTARVEDMRHWLELNQLSYDPKLDCWIKL